MCFTLTPCWGAILLWLSQQQQHVCGLVICDQGAEMTPVVDTHNKHMPVVILKGTDLC
jgi:hypothetical protein